MLEPAWNILSPGTGVRTHWDSEIITDWDSHRGTDSYVLGH